MTDELIQQKPKRRRGRPAVDIRGMQYGWLVPIEPLPREGKGQTMWKCICTGEHVFTAGLPREVVVRYSALTCGKQRSCGCMHAYREPRSQWGNRVIARECLITKNEFIEQYGMQPAPAWAKTRDEVEQAFVRQYDGTDEEARRLAEELGIPYNDGTD